MTLNSIFQQYLNKSSKNSLDRKQVAQTENNVINENAIIDIEASTIMCCDDPNFTREIFQMLADDLKNTKSTLTKAYVNNDIKALRAELHRTRGGVCYIKAPQLEKALKDFHLMTRTESPIFSEMEKAYQSLQQAIENFWCEWESTENY